MHVTRILPETFRAMETGSTYTGPNYWVLFTVGDVEADGKIYKGCAIKILARRDGEDTNEVNTLSVVFKGKDRIQKASQWLHRFSGGHWGQRQHSWLDIMAGDGDENLIHEHDDNGNADCAACYAEFEVFNGETFMPADIEE